MRNVRYWYPYTANEALSLLNRIDAGLSMLERQWWFRFVPRVWRDRIYCWRDEYNWLRLHNMKLTARDAGPQR